MPVIPAHQSADDPAGHARSRARRLRAGPAVPAADRARGRVLHARRRRDVHQHGAAAPVDPRRAAGRPQARRREGRRPRPGPRLPPPRRREAVRERRLPPGDLLHRPARVRQLAVLRVGAGVMAFEKLLDVEVPRRAEYIRVLSSELNRIASHALFLGWMALDLGGLTPILWCFIERDEIVEMLAALTGQRMLFNYFRIGGVNGDLNHEFMSRLGDWMSQATEPDRGRTTRCSTRTRSSSAGCAASARSTRATALRMVHDRPEPAGDRRAVRRPPGAPVQRLPGARVRHPDPRPRATASPATCSASTRSSRASGSSTSASTRCPTARSWPSCRGCSGRGRAGPTPRSRARAASTPPTRSATAPTSRSGCGSTTRRSSTSSRSALMMPGHLIADTMAIMASLDPIMGGVDK